MKIRLKISGRIVEVPNELANQLILGGFAELPDDLPAKPKENTLIKRNIEQRDV
jgi:hypothetical protein